ncbi:MAG TPA: hypothetical protein VFD76_11185 [Gemmatimonadales bacterium]|jgi:hypothetical protein|nr:hypothetical protein [Gemmatimonadales bacterium]
MKRLAVVLAVVAMGACQKAEQKPAAQAPAADTSHNMMQMSDTSKMQMADTSKHMMMADTAKKMAPAKPAPAKPAAKKKP